jgi:hypothetical protein
MERKIQNRTRSGRYDYDGDMDRLCVCGHTLGQHAAASPHDCFVNEALGHEGEENCTCPKFRPARKS